LRYDACVDRQVSVARCGGCGVDHEPGSAACPLSRIGTTVAGRYRLDRLLGVGGTGAVYEAENLSLGRRVALKLLHAQHAVRADIVDRFRREARSVANLKHPGFAQVYALDRDAQGQFFIEMELLEGVALDRLVRQRPASVDRVVALLASALDALAVAHQAGLVHRDLKPENLFVCHDRRLGEYVKVLDFGIARAADDLRMTVTGQFMGTIHYASPEQLRDASTVDARSDIYSFGATAFELLTGTCTAGGGSTADVVTRIMTQNVMRSVASIRPEVPAWLDAIVARALSADPAQRFANAGDMLAVLRAHVSASSAWGPPRVTGPYIPSAPVPSTARRFNAPFLVGVILVVGVATGATVLALSRSSSKGAAPVVTDRKSVV
jgi:serine/threonine-protein kinase